jgi:hypothetical protein
MNTLMNGQGGSLNELFPAVGKVANVRPNATVDSFCKVGPRQLHIEKMIQNIILP